MPSETIFPYIQNIATYLPEVDSTAGAPNPSDIQKLSPGKSRKKKLFASGKGKEAKILGTIVRVCKDEAFLTLENMLNTIKDAVFCGVSGSQEGGKTEQFLTTVGYTLRLSNLSPLCRVIWRGIENGCEGSWGALKELLSVCDEDYKHAYR